jgi:integration host factor subunit beta
MSILLMSAKYRLRIHCVRMPQTKAALIEAIAFKMKLPIGRADALVNEVFDAMVEALQRSEGVEIRGFGTFTIREYGADQGRNPRSGEPVHVKAKRLSFFKVGKELRERVNNNDHALRANAV